MSELLTNPFLETEIKKQFGTKSWKVKNKNCLLTLRGSTYFFVPKGSGGGGTIMPPPKVSVKTVKEIIH